MRKLMPTLLAALLTGALLTGCFEAVTSYVVNEDGSGSQTLRIALPAELAQAFGDEMPSVEELEDDPDLRALIEALGDQGEISFFSSREDGWGFEVTIFVPASDDFGAALAEVLESLPDSDLPLNEFTGDTPTTIRRDGDNWIFEMELLSLAESGLAESGEEEFADFANMFLDQSTVTVMVLLPGTVTQHNADTVLPDGTLQWVQQGSDPTRAISARSDVGKDGLAIPIWLLIGGIVLLAALLTGALALMATRGGDSNARGSGRGESPAAAPPAEDTPPSGTSGSA